MKSIKNSFKKIDYGLLITFLLLLIIGLLMVYSASNIVASFKYNDQFYFLKRQLIFTILGLIVGIVIISIDINKIKKYTSYIFLISVFLLILVLIPNVGIVRGGARSWLGIGFLTIQPSEIMKVSIILLLAKYFGVFHKTIKKFKVFIIILMIPMVIFALIMLQPDFGTGIVIVLSSMILIFLTNAKIKYFLLLILILIIFVFILIIIAPYRMERILAFLNPWSDPLGSGFQSIQSMFSIAPSGILGLGYNNSIQKHFFLPEPQNDFIFAILVEELGLIGGLFVIVLFLIIVVKSIKYAINSPDKYLSYLSCGIGISIYVQVFINISVVIGLLPVTGITLPIISYGGTSLIISFVQIGILLNISKVINE